MKIVVSVHHYPPRYSSGVEMVAQRHSRWLLGQGHEVHVVCVERIDAERPLTVESHLQDGVMVHRLGLALVGTSEHLGVRFQDGLVKDWFRSFLASTRPDILHSHSSYILGTGPVEAAREVGIPTVATLHDYWYVCPRVTLLRSDGVRCDGAVAAANCAACVLGEKRRYRLVGKALARMHPSTTDPGPHPVPGWTPAGALTRQMTERREVLESALRSFDRIVVLAPFAQQLLAERGLRPPQVLLIPSGHDLQGWGHRERTPSSRGLRVGYLGQIAPHKGIHVLIDAFRRGMVRSSGGELTIHGDMSRFPKYAAELRALAGSDGRISFPGAYCNDEVERVLTEIDVLVVPSLWFETRPLVIMEAFAAGVPVIASDLPNLQYQVRDGVDGLLFPAGDALRLARALAALAHNPALLAQLSQGIGVIRTLDQELREIEGVYREVSAVPRSPRGVLPALVGAR